MTVSLEFTKTREFYQVYTAKIDVLKTDNSVTISGSVIDHEDGVNKFYTFSETINYNYSGDCRVRKFLAMNPDAIERDIKEENIIFYPSFKEIHIRIHQIVGNLDISLN
jgi:hypothetical protein